MQIVTQYSQCGLAKLLTHIHAHTHAWTHLDIEYIIETIAGCLSIEDENTGSTTDWSRATSDCFVSISTQTQTNKHIDTHTQTHTQPLAERANKLSAGMNRMQLAHDKFV